jgi:hypothetical protein
LICKDFANLALTVVAVVVVVVLLPDPRIQGLKKKMMMMMMMMMIGRKSFVIFFNVSDEVVESCAERCSCTQMARTHPCSLEADTCGSRFHSDIPQPLTRLPWNLPVLLVSRET